MNDERVHRFADALAARGVGMADEARIRIIVLSVLSRQPTAGEVQRLQAFLAQADASHAETLARAGARRREVEKHRAAITGILEPVRERLREHRSRPSRSRKEAVPVPIARWEFDGGARDSIGSAHGTLREGARVEAGALILDGRRAHVVTGALERDLRAKTLEAWVRLDDLNQSGGGVISVQTPDGHVFDAIVFGENAPGEWLAGSDHFRRTKPLGGPRETEATQRPIHVAIVYHADGRIEAFRDGFPYGTSYESEGPVTFAQGETVVSFGVRHLPAGGNKLLAGRIERAQLYDRALTADEVAGSAAAVTEFVPDDEVIAALPPDTRRRYEQHREALGDAREHLAALGPLPEKFDENAAWNQLALAMFTLKEFIYLR